MHLFMLVKFFRRILFLFHFQSIDPGWITSRQIEAALSFVMVCVNFNFYFEIIYLKSFFELN